MLTVTRWRLFDLSINTWLIYAAFIFCYVNSAFGSDDELHIESDLISYIETHSKSEIVSTAGLQKFLTDWSTRHQEKLPDFVRWPGTEFGLLIEDLDGDREPDIILSQILSREKAKLIILKSKNKWQEATEFPIKINFPFLLTESNILFFDVNGDKIKDIYLRFIGEGRIYPKSTDCLVIFRNSSYLDSQYMSCYLQEAAAEKNLYIQKRLNKNLYPFGHLVDLNGDSKYELVVASLLIPVDVASSTYWPDIYAWKDGAYRIANKEFPQYFLGFKYWLQKTYGEKPKAAGPKEALKRVTKLLEEQH